MSHPHQIQTPASSTPQTMPPYHIAPSPFPHAFPPQPHLPSAYPYGSSTGMYNLIEQPAYGHFHPSFHHSFTNHHMYTPQHEPSHAFVHSTIPHEYPREYPSEYPREMHPNPSTYRSSTNNNPGDNHDISKTRQQGASDSINHQSPASIHVDKPRSGATSQMSTCSHSPTMLPPPPPTQRHPQLHTTHTPNGNHEFMQRIVEQEASIRELSIKISTVEDSFKKQIKALLHRIQTLEAKEQGSTQVFVDADKPGKEQEQQEQQDKTPNIISPEQQMSLEQQLSPEEEQVQTPAISSSISKQDVIEIDVNVNAVVETIGKETTEGSTLKRKSDRTYIELDSLLPSQPSSLKKVRVICSQQEPSSPTSVSTNVSSNVFKKEYNVKLKDVFQLIQDSKNQEYVNSQLASATTSFSIFLDEHGVISKDEQRREEDRTQLFRQFKLWLQQFVKKHPYVIQANPKLVSLVNNLQTKVLQTKSNPNKVVQSTSHKVVSASSGRSVHSSSSGLDLSTRLRCSLDVYLSSITDAMNKKPKNKTIHFSSMWNCTNHQKIKIYLPLSHVETINLFQFGDLWLLNMNDLLRYPLCKTKPTSTSNAHTTSSTEAQSLVPNMNVTNDDEHTSLYEDVFPQRFLPQQLFIRPVTYKSSTVSLALLSQKEVFHFLQLFLSGQIQEIIKVNYSDTFAYQSMYWYQIVEKCIPLLYSEIDNSESSKPRDSQPRK